MKEAKRIRLIEEAALAQRAGVVLSLRDWERMSPARRGAWVAVREQVPAPAPAAPASSSDDTTAGDLLEATVARMASRGAR